MRDTKEMTADELLVARSKAGDVAAYNHLVSQHWDRIFARSMQLLKNREDAEEITQDTFIRAQRGLENFRGDASFSSWVYQIATNLAHNRYWYWFRRKRGQSMSLQHSLDSEGEFTLEDVLADDCEHPGEAAVTSELEERVSECMEQLSDIHCEVLTLRNVRNMSYEEIAEELGISVGTVKSRIARARDNLRELLGSDFQ